MRASVIPGVFLCLLSTGCAEPTRPTGAPPDAEYSGTATWDGRWISCESWEEGVSTRCSISSGSDVERGEYLVDDRIGFGGLLAQQATDETDPLRQFLVGVKYSGLLDADWVHSKDVHIRPVETRLVRGDGAIVTFAVSQRYRSMWVGRDLRSFAAECSLHMDEPLSERLPRLVRTVGMNNEKIEYITVKPRSGSLTDYAEIFLGDERFGVTLVGDCWIRTASLD